MKLFDAHFHIIDPKYPLIENQGYLPQPFTVQDYLKQTQSLGVKGGAVVSGSFQGLDQDYLTATLAQLGAGFVGVTQLPESVTDDEILILAQQGVRALRFNVKRGGVDQLRSLVAFSQRVYDVAKWHIELYIGAEQLSYIQSKLVTLPAVSIDHLGLEQSALKLLLALVDHGVKVKATGFGRVEFDVLSTLKAIHAVNPQALMFGSDLPSTRAIRPFSIEDIALIQDNFSSSECDHILYANAAAFYGICPLITGS